MTEQVLTAARTAPAVAAPTSRRRIRARAVAVATVATSTIYLVAAAAGADFKLTDPGKTQSLHLTLPIIVVFTVYFAMLGWGTLALTERYLPRRSRTTWTSLAAATLLLSYGPILIEHATVGTKVSLAIIHTTVAAALVPFVRSSCR